MKVTIWYDWYDGPPDNRTPCMACAELPHGIILTGYGATFENAKEKVMAKVRLLPSDEEVEI